MNTKKRIKGTEITTNIRSCSFGSKGTKGDCFSVSLASSILDKKADCYSASTFDRPCFYIKCDEEYDEIFTPVIDFSELGFTAIKCIQAHGLNSMKVIGKYIPIGGTEIEVLADVIYSPSVDGGIGSLKWIYKYVELSSICATFSELDKFTYDDVVRLECWDNISSISNLAIVTSSDVHWVEPLLFGLYSSTVDVMNGAIAINAPFLTEDTFGVFNSSTSWGASTTCVTTVHGFTDVNKGYYINSGASAGTQDIITIGASLSHAENPSIDISCGYIISDYANTNDSFRATRKNVIVNADGKVLVNVSLEDQDVLTISATPTVWLGYYHVPPEIYIPAQSFTANTTTVNISFDGTYVVADINGTAEWVNTITNTKGTEVATNFTVSKGVFISADGTKDILQKIIEP